MYAQASAGVSEAYYHAGNLQDSKELNSSLNTCTTGICLLSHGPRSLNVLFENLFLTSLASRSIVSTMFRLRGQVSLNESSLRPMLTKSLISFILYIFYIFTYFPNIITGMEENKCDLERGEIILFITKIVWTLVHVQSWKLTLCMCI